MRERACNTSILTADIILAADFYEVYRLCQNIVDVVVCVFFFLTRHGYRGGLRGLVLACAGSGAVHVVASHRWQRANDVAPSLLADLSIDRSREHTHTRRISRRFIPCTRYLFRTSGDVNKLDRLVTIDVMTPTRDSPVTSSSLLSLLDRLFFFIRQAARPRDRRS